MREELIHHLVRQYLKDRDWQLIAGQYPDGSDDELHPLYVVDPYFARDNSPDHRRHSLNKFVPDLIAIKNNFMLVNEIKPNYSRKDEVKLEKLTSERLADLVNALKDFNKTRSIPFAIPVEKYLFCPFTWFQQEIQI